MVFTKILVPFDNSANSKRALNKAFALATLTNGSVTLVHVITYHKAIAKVVEPYKETVIAHVKKFMNEIEKDASRRDILIEEKILYGNPAEEILDFMKKKKFDLVIMGKRGVTKLTGSSLGSVSNALVQTSKVPVLVIT